MKTLTVRIPQSLDDALQRASVQRHMSKSAMVREALEKTLASELDQGDQPQRGSSSGAAYWLQSIQHHPAMRA